MDVNMPEMDGLTAARMIRKLEKDSDKRIRIIALTASALRGDREKCMAAGMDDYLAKPIRSNDLFERVEANADAAGIPTGKDSGSDDMVFNSRDALERVDGDQELMAEMIKSFLDDEQGMMENISVAIENADSSGLQHAAHELKGTAGLLSATRAFKSALELETIGRKGTLTGARKSYDKLREEIGLLRDALEEFLKRVV
jgi:CheY-like chemotaxis protein